LELEVCFKLSVVALPVVTVHFNLIDHPDAAALHEYQQFINSVRINEAIGENGVDLLVADPAALASVFEKPTK
jgi:hypothetical protein